MNNAWLALAAAAALIGMVIIAAAAVQSFLALLSGCTLIEARLSMASGVISGMEFLLAGTLFKTLALSEWNQIGMAISIYAIRVVLKQAFVRDQKNADKKTAAVSCRC